MKKKLMMLSLLLTGMSAQLHGMENKEEKVQSSGIEDVKKGQIAYQKICEISERDDLATQEKIALIKEQMQYISSISDYEEEGAQPSILAKAIRNGDLALVKFLVESCGVDINARIRVYYKSRFSHVVDVPTHFYHYYFDHQGKAQKRSNKTTQTILEYAAGSAGGYKESLSIYSYLLNHPNIVVTDEIVHFCLSNLHFDGLNSDLIMSTMQKKCSGYQTKFFILNNEKFYGFDCDKIKVSLGTAQDWLEAAYILVTSGLTHIGRHVEIILDTAMQRNDDQKLSSDSIKKVIDAIQKHPLLEWQEKIRLLQHPIFKGLVQFPLNQENCIIALDLAQNGDFRFAKEILKQDCSKKDLPLKEITELGKLAIEQDENNIFVEIMNNYGLSKSNLRDLVQRALQMNRYAYIYLSTYKLPENITSIMQKSNSSVLSQLENPNNQDVQMLCNVILDMKKDMREKALEKLLDDAGRMRLQCLDCPFYRSLYSQSCNILLSNIWNISPSGKKADGSTSSEIGVIGANNARHIIAFMGPDWFKGQPFYTEDELKHRWPAKESDVKPEPKFRKKHIEMYKDSMSLEQAAKIGTVDSQIKRDCTQLSSFK